MYNVYTGPRMMIKIEPSSEAAVKHVIDHLSEADELELLTVSGEDPAAGIRWGRNVSSDSFAIHPVLDGDPASPVALFGVVDDEKTVGFGIIWMVTTPMLLRTSRDIIETAPKWLSEWLNKYPRGLHNIVDSRNERHVRWLRKMGATFYQGPEIRGVPFLYFQVTKDPQCARLLQ